MTEILNLTQHAASIEQTAQGVIDLPAVFRKELSELLTFDELPDIKEMRERASRIIELVKQTPFGEIDEEGLPTTHFKAMIGGAPFFMPILADALECTFMCEPVYAFSKRDSVEDPATGVKTSVFKHIGFVSHSFY